MTYFIEVTEYQTYANAEADFHFSYNANSGGGQSFLGGMFSNDKGKLSSPTILDGCVGIFKIVYKNANGKEIGILLDDINGKYEIKPRGTGSSSMKLSVGTKLESPSKLISSFFMLPSTCAIKNPANLDVSILSSNNFWLQSMWLKCDIPDASKLVYLLPKDFVFCGGCNKDKQGNGRYFKLEAEKRIQDIISLSENAERLPKELGQYINSFSDIYLGKASFNYEDCVNATKQIMILLAKEYPAEYSGIEDPLPFLKSLMTRLSLRRKNIDASYSGKYKDYLSVVQVKPFLLLAGISGTGKSRIVREFAFKSCPKCLQDKAGTTPGNYCMIEVKPNWHDSTELLGYYSRLGKAGYQFTKFVKFLVKAKMFPNVPFFVCLDEMNLAPVEQYFAEILSILETRKHPKNVETGEVDMETVKTEPIIDAQYFRELAEMPHTKNAQTGEPFSSNLTDRDIYLKLFGMNTESDIDTEVGNRTDLTTEGLELPDNVVIIGTVNMDDTTHQFSRKVIDRAMTIEMNGGNLRNMFGGSKNMEYLPESEQKKWQNAFTRRYVSADEVLDAHPDVAEELMEKLPTKLEEINLALKGTPFMVSYRVLNELTIMVGVMLDEGMGLDEAIAASVNNILLMKILPRVEGDAEMFAMSREYKAKAGVSYDNRLEWLKDIAPDIKESSAEAASENDDTEEKTGTIKECQQTAKEKIQEMIDRLNNQEFTRFWP